MMGCDQNPNFLSTLIGRLVVRRFMRFGRVIQQEQKIGHIPDMNYQEGEQSSLGETTLEDYLVKSGFFVGDANELSSQSFVPQVGLSPSPSMDTLSDTAPGMTRGSGDFDKTIERRLKRKIKNRESAARSRARKQAYQNELVTKVSRLEEENMKLKKEKELENFLPMNVASEPRYQLRRTSSI